MKSFTELDAWKVAMELQKEAYKILQCLPQTERNNLYDQLQRACTSVVTNIAEGFSRITPPDKLHKFIIARGECSEVHACFLCIENIGYVPKTQIDHAVQLSIRTGKLITGLIKVQRHTTSPSHHSRSHHSP